MAARKPKLKRLNPKDIFAFLFKEERRSSSLLLVAAVAALVIANSRWSVGYYHVLSTHYSLGPVALDARHWINEGLMALFFLVVGIEVKREFISGELKTWRKAAFPVVAAGGGMMAPALLFSTLNPYMPQSSGWAVPMATDIAIALGVLGLLGRRIPRSLRVFLLTLAIVDDIGSIAIIGIFYNQPSSTFALLLAVILCLGLVAVHRWKLWPLAFLGLGLAVWYCLLLAGVSGVVAGIILALLMPLKSRRNTSSGLQATEIIEDLLIPLTSFIIVPVFVFANAGITFSGMSLSGGGMSVFTGVLLGLVVGKPAGILLAGWLGHALRIAHKPPDISWVQLVGTGFVAGIGFTVALLVNDLAYRGSGVLQSAATLGIFSASVVAGVMGLVILTVTAKRGRT
jgi:NhaA family Na+:H+ antiporter